MSAAVTTPERLSTLQAAWVIARRDFVAVLFSRTFLFFLLGPLFPFVVGGLAGSITGEVLREADTVVVGVAMSPADTAAMIEASASFSTQLGGGAPMQAVAEAANHSAFDAREYLEARRGNFAVIVTGTLAAPQVVGTAQQTERWRGAIELIAATATQAAPTPMPEATSEVVASSAATDRSNRIATAQAGQLLLFLLTMLLAGMVLSNLVEEKANKIIEILAAAIPMDAVFMGKLFAMLAVSMVGITVWGTCAFAFWAIAGEAVSTGTDPANLPAPAVGWALFLILGITYFAMAYLLLGALFLTIGAMASTVREVQTLSMPVTMLQLLVFFLAAYTITQPGSTLEKVAIIFPLSSPFAMLARAAMDETLWVHAAALAWQAAAVVGIVKAGSMLFRKRVMKSGGAGREKKSRFGKRAALAEPAE